MIKLKNYQNWAVYPKLVIVCFSFFSLARIMIVGLTKKFESDNMMFWIVCFGVSLLLSIVFQQINKSEELKRITHTSNYKAAYQSVEILYKKVIDAFDDKDTKVFISKEMQYLQDPIKQYIFLKGIFEKADCVKENKGKTLCT